MLNTNFKNEQYCVSFITYLLQLHIITIIDLDLNMKKKIDNIEHYVEELSFQ